MNKEEIIKKVIEIISDSCGLDIDIIKPNSTLFIELGISSIDMVDVLYDLEMEYSIDLKLSDLENESREKLNGSTFEIDNVITEQGLELIKKEWPEIPAHKLTKGLTANEIIYIITVETLAKMVWLKLEKEKYSEEYNK